MRTSLSYLDSCSPNTNFYARMLFLFSMNLKQDVATFILLIFTKRLIIETLPNKLEITYILFISTLL